ncbi:MAG: TetR/AcrR family transcriptional regulator [Cyanobacteria bacterium J06632_22]
MNVQSSDKRRLILEATLALIAEKGIHATPMSQISKRAGVSPGTIYHYFENKEVLINELYLAQKQALAADAFRGYDSQKPYAERFLLIWQNALDNLLVYPARLSFLEQCSASPIISTEVQEEGYRYVAPVIDFVTQGMAEGHLQTMEMPLMLAIINGSVVAISKLHLFGQLDLTAEHRDAAAIACWNGVKAN